MREIYTMKIKSSHVGPITNEHLFQCIMMSNLSCKNIAQIRNQGFERERNLWD